jgi:hypothetical protein
MESNFGKKDIDTADKMQTTAGSLAMFRNIVSKMLKKAERIWVQSLEKLI